MRDAYLGKSIARRSMTNRDAGCIHKMHRPPMHESSRCGMTTHRSCKTQSTTSVRPSLRDDWRDTQRGLNRRLIITTRGRHTSTRYSCHALECQKIVRSVPCFSYSSTRPTLEPLPPIRMMTGCALVRCGQPACAGADNKEQPH